MGALTTVFGNKPILYGRTDHDAWKQNLFALVPKLQIGNQFWEAPLPEPADRKLELPKPLSQPGDWE
jgi:hypothetical protein